MSWKFKHLRLNIYHRVCLSCFISNYIIHTCHDQPLIFILMLVSSPLARSSPAWHSVEPGAASTSLTVLTCLCCQLSPLKSKHYKTQSVTISRGYRWTLCYPNDYTHCPGSASYSFYKLLGNRSLIKNITQRAVIDIVKHAFYKLYVSYASQHTFWKVEPSNVLKSSFYYFNEDLETRQIVWSRNF